MRTIYKSLAAALVLVPTLTGCVDETFPTTGATEEQLGASAKAAEALLWAMPAFNNKFDVLGAGSANASDYDYGYPSIMHIRDVMTADMPIVASGYDHYTYWENNTYQGEGYIFPQFVWNYYTQRALTANNCIGAINPEGASAQMLSYLGMGYAFRAQTYLEMAQMYEFLPNNAVSSVNLDGNNVEGLCRSSPTRPQRRRHAKIRAPHTSRCSNSSWLTSTLPSSISPEHHAPTRLSLTQP